MVKPKPIIITSGILVLIGIAITAYQSQTTSENLVNQQETISVGKQMTVTKAMDPNNNQKAVYAIQVTDLKNDDNIKAIVIDSIGNTIITKSVTKSPIQEFFKVSSSGNYTLQIENHGQREIQILGIIGYYPEGIELADISGFIVLMIGLAGLAIGMMFLIKNRVKPQS
jgi:membrane protein implicated in regulation of membrane protease activity